MSRVLVIGDSCTDVFVYGDIDRVCPEAPVPVFNPTHQTENGGMAKNVVTNLKALAEVYFIDCEVDFITNPNDIVKKRYVDNRSGQMVLRVDEHDYCKHITKEQIYSTFKKCYDAVIISDYCKGFLGEQAIRDICKNHNNVFIDTKKKLGDFILNAKFIKINSLEHQKNFEIIPNYPELEEKLIVTIGKDGCNYNGKVYPTEEVPVKDVSGAGDTFLSGLVCEYIKTKNIEKSIEFAQKCTTIVVQKHGVATI